MLFIVGYASHVEIGSLRLAVLVQWIKQNMLINTRSSNQHPNKVPMLYRYFTLPEYLRYMHNLWILLVGLVIETLISIFHKGLARKKEFNHFIKDQLRNLPYQIYFIDYNQLKELTILFIHGLHINNLSIELAQKYRGLRIVSYCVVHFSYP